MCYNNIARVFFLKQPLTKAIFRIFTLENMLVPRLIVNKAEIRNMNTAFLNALKIEKLQLVVATVMAIFIRFVSFVIKHVIGVGCLIYSCSLRLHVTSMCLTIHVFLTDCATNKSAIMRLRPH